MGMVYFWSYGFEVKKQKLPHTRSSPMSHPLAPMPRPPCEPGPASLEVGGLTSWHEPVEYSDMPDLESDDDMPPLWLDDDASPPLEHMTANVPLPGYRDNGL